MGDQPEYYRSGLDFHVSDLYAGGNGPYEWCSGEILFALTLFSSVVGYKQKSIYTDIWRKRFETCSVISKYILACINI